MPIHESRDPTALAVAKPGGEFELVSDPEGTGFIFKGHPRTLTALFARARQDGLIGWQRNNNRGDCWISPDLVRDYKFWQAIKFSAVSQAVHDATACFLKS